MDEDFSGVLVTVTVTVFKACVAIPDTTMRPRTYQTTWKFNYFLKMVKCLGDYPKCFLVGGDNVGSTQREQIHVSTEGRLRY